MTLPCPHSVRRYPEPTTPIPIYNEYSITPRVLPATNAYEMKEVMAHAKYPLQPQLTRTSHFPKSANFHVIVRLVSRIQRAMPTVYVAV